MTQNARRIDTLDLSNTLETAGVEKKQAEAMVRIVIDAIDNQGHLSTKEDMRETELRLTKEIAKTNLEIEKVRVDIRETELRITKEIAKTNLEIEKVRAEIKDTEARIRSDLRNTDLKIEQVRAEIEKVRGEIERSGKQTIIWLVGTCITLTALVVAAIKLL